MTLSLSLFPLGWQHYLAGGLLAGAGVALLFVLTGRIGGMSTVFSSTWSYAVQRPFFQQARIVALLADQAAAGVLVVMATHDAWCAEQADREIHLDAGRMSVVR